MGKTKDLIGTRRGVFTLLDRKRENNFTYYLCKCDYCGSETWIRDCNISRYKSCGCLKHSTKYQIGDIVNNFKILDIKKDNRIYYHCICTCCKKEKWARDLKQVSCDCERYKKYIGETIHNLRLDEMTRVNGHLKFKCTCTLCGSSTIVSLYNIKRGSNKSCGCLNRNVYQKYSEPMFIEGTNIGQLKSNKSKRGSKLGIRGVSQRANGKYLAQITFKGTNYNLGTWDTIEEAKAAYEKGRERFFKPVIDKYNNLKT